MARNLITAGGNTSKKDIIPQFQYTGTYNWIQESDLNWKIEFLTSGSLILFNELKDDNIDIFLVGGGGGGSAGGGGGGYTATYLNEKWWRFLTYDIVIGSGGTGRPDNGDATAGGNTSAFGQTVAGGAGGQGGSGRGIGGAGGSGGGGYSAGVGGTDGGNGTKSSYNGGAGQGTTTREFGNPSGKLYSGGGAPTSGTPGDETAGASGQPGLANRGGGGGYNASGGSGIVIIRNHR